MHTLAMTIKTPCLIAESNYLYEKDINQGTELITVLKPPCVCPYVHACVCVHVYGCVILSSGWPHIKRLIMLPLHNPRLLATAHLYNCVIDNVIQI